MKGLPEKIDSKFRYVLLAATRAEQLMRGAPSKEEPGKRKDTRVAMDEVMEDKISWDYGLPPEPVEDLLEEALAEGDGESAPADGESTSDSAPAADA